MSIKDKRITLAITGASGAQYGLKLLKALVSNDFHVALMISGAARIVINTETSLDLPENPEEQINTIIKLVGAKPEQVRLYTKLDWFAPVASGSSAPRAMVICPASGGCLSAIAHGASNNLIERAADVALKERRQLIVVPRETPLSTVHLENMLKLSQMGVVVMPASPGFYYQPETVEDMVDFVVARILDQLGIEQTMVPKWGEE